MGFKVKKYSYRCRELWYTSKMYTGTMCSFLDGKIKLIGDASLSRRDFSRVIKPLNLFGVNINSHNKMLPINLKEQIY